MSKDYVEKFIRHNFPYFSSKYPEREIPFELYQAVYWELTQNKTIDLDK